MPPLSNNNRITLMQQQPVPASPNTSPASTRRLRSLSLGSSAEFCTRTSEDENNHSNMFKPQQQSQSPPPSAPTLKKDDEPSNKKQVSFNPRVLVIETRYVVDDCSCSDNPKTKSIFDPSTTWYTGPEIDDIQKDAYFIIQRFARNWHLGPNDCLRGLEAQTSKCTATKVRLFVYKDLVLGKKDSTKRMIQESPQRVRHMTCMILKAAEQDALELAQLDAEQAHKYQNGIEDDPEEQEVPGFKCFLWELPKWLVPPRKAPAIVDVPI